MKLSDTRVRTRTPEAIKDRIRQLRAIVADLTDYTLMKAGDEDWHGVEDGASDIRDKLAMIKALEWVLCKPGNQEEMRE